MRLVILLPLLIGAWLDGAVPTRSAPEPVCQGLTLNLQPGLISPRYHVHLVAAKDIPPGSVTLQLPLYPGATPTTHVLEQPAGFSYPASPYLKTALAAFHLAAGERTATRWYRHTFAGCGYTFTGASQAGRYGNVVSRGIGFQANGNPKLQVSISFENDRTGGVWALYLVTEETLPARPAGSYLPNDVKAIRVRYLLGMTTASFNQEVRLTVKRRRDIRTLITAVNSLKNIQAGPQSCAADRGQGSFLTFVIARHSAVHLSVDPACDIVRVGGYRALRDEVGRRYWVVWNALTTIVNRTRKAK